MTQATSVNIASFLPAMAKIRPNALAVVFPHGRDRYGRVSYTHLTFAQLDQESDRLARGLERIGIGRGVWTILMVSPSLEFFALTFALFKAGAVPVMIDPGIGIKNLGRCIAEAEPRAFIGIPKAHAARVVLGWGRRTIRIKVMAGPGLLPGATTIAEVRETGKDPIPYKMAETEEDEMAAILFTSGSTGPPKGVVYTHEILARQVELLKKHYGIEPGEIDLPTFPLFALFAPALGMTAIIPDMDATRPGQVNPERIIEAICNFGVTNMFGSPALINRVGRYGASRGIKLPTLKRVISAGAPVHADTVWRFSQMLSPRVQVFSGYGATEALPVCSVGSDTILNETRHQTDQGKGVCVGHPVKGITVKIIRIVDTPILSWSDDLLVPVGHIGEIVAKGPVVTRKYYHRPESTALAKISDRKTNGFYHRMGDLGYLDKTGRLWFCGRKSQRVILKKKTLFTIPCEGVFNTHKRVFRSALVGVAKGDSLLPVLCVELEPEARMANRQKIREELLELGHGYEHTRDIRTILFHPSFPVDIRHNAKIFREKLAVWASKELS